MYHIEEAANMLKLLGDKTRLTIMAIFIENNS